MKIYNYHPITKEFLNESEADKDPLEKGKYLIPANSTTIPLEVKPEPNKTIVFKDDSWVLVDDFRGKVLWEKETGQRIKIKDLEVAPDFEKLTEVEPPMDVFSIWGEKGWEKQRVPANGFDLINFINTSKNKKLSDEESFNLVEKLAPFFIFLQQERCNPCSKETLSTIKKLLDKKLITTEKDLVINLIESWEKDKKFEKEKDN